MVFAQATKESLLLGPLSTTGSNKPTAGLDLSEASYAAVKFYYSAHTASVAPSIYFEESETDIATNYSSATLMAATLTLTTSTATQSAKFFFQPAGRMRYLKPVSNVSTNTVLVTVVGETSRLDTGPGENVATTGSDFGPTYVVFV